MGRFAPLRKLRLARIRRARQSREDARANLIDSIIGLVGQSAMTWAGVERVIDELIGWYQHAATKLQTEHPRSLSSKLKYLRAMQCDPAFTPEIKEFLRSTRIEAKRLGDRRHELIHGLLWRRPLTSGEWQSQRVIYEGPHARLVLTKISEEDFRQILREIAALLHDLSPKVWAITGGDPRVFPTGDIEQASRKLGMA
ncbi:MAG: hypothetical protein ABIP91_06315 [Sphingomicrobium sp.]